MHRLGKRPVFARSSNRCLTPCVDVLSVVMPNTDALGCPRQNDRRSIYRIEVRVNGFRSGNVYWEPIPTNMMI
jgi:hypothetical protein